MLTRCRPTLIAKRFASNYSGIEVRSRQAVRSKNDSVNAFVHISEEAENLPNGPLHDVSIAIKDNICTSSMPTTCSSNMLRDFTSPYDATVVRLLREAGADLVGKVNLDEFGMGSMTRYSIHGPVVNPFQSPNTSTEGDQCIGDRHWRLHTTSGFLLRRHRIQAIIWFDQHGVISFADSLDCVGVISKTTEGVRNVTDVIMAHDPRDPTSVPSDTRNTALSLFPTFKAASLAGLRVGVPKEYFPSELSPSVVSPTRRVLSVLESHGATIVPVSLPSTPYALSAYYVISSAEASSNLARYDGVEYGLNVVTQRTRSNGITMRNYAASRSEGFGPEVRKRILLGTYALRADAFDNYFQQALRVRQLVRNDFNAIFRAPDVRYTSSSLPTSAETTVDIIIHPTAIQSAPLLEPPHGDDCDGLDAYVQDVLTVPASLAGLPALSIPAGKTADRNKDPWPVGVTIAGQWGSDQMILDIGQILDI